MSNRQGVTYDADNLVNLTPGSLTYNGATYDVTAAGSATAAQATANAALAAAAAAQATANAALPKAGGTMTGQINMSNQKIVSLGTPTVSTDAATKGYVDTSVVGLLDLQGTIDCSANPNYPAANKGDVWVVSVAGLIGGGAGISVQAGDALVALADNAGGTQAAVGSSWSILQANLVGALLAVNNLSDVQNVTTARTNLGLGTVATLTASTDGTLAANSDSNVATQKATKTYADTKIDTALGIAADQGLYTTAASTWGSFSLTSIWRSFLGTVKAVWNEANGYLGIGGTPAYRLHVLGTTANHIVRSDMGLDINSVANPTSLTAALLAVAGNVNVGNHYYSVSYVTAYGETVPFRFGGTGRLITTVAGSQQVQLTIPISSDYRVIARRIYRSKAGGNYFDQYLVATINDNTTATYTDNIADAALGTVNQFYRDNTTSTYITSQGTPYIVMGEATTALGLNAARNMLVNPATYTGGFNVCVGLESGYGLTSATRVVAIGQNAARGMTTGSDSVCIGAGAGESSNGGASVFIGRNAGLSGGINAVAVGAFCATATSSYGVAIGSNAQTSTTGNGNIGIGYYTANTLTSGAFNITMGAAVLPVSLTGSNQLNIGNTIYGTGIYGSTSSLSSTPATGAKVGIGLQTPTAVLHLKAGTATANTAPLKFTSGTNLTATEAGAMEYNGTLSFTDSSAVRKDVALKTTYTPTLTPALIVGAGYTEQTFTVTGLATTDTVIVNGPAAAANSVLVHARVSAADTLALTWITDAANITPTSGAYRIVAIRS